MRAGQRCGEALDQKGLEIRRWRRWSASERRILYWLRHMTCRPQKERRTDRNVIAFNMVNRKKVSFLSRRLGIQPDG
jgi:hypothetical protein